MVLLINLTFDKNGCNVIAMRTQTSTKKFLYISTNFSIYILIVLFVLEINTNIYWFKSYMFLRSYKSSLF